MPARDIIVIGASAGGFDAIQRLAAGLPANLQAAVFITLHVYGKSDSMLPQLLNRAGTLPAAHPRDGEPVHKGRIYVAPPDYHLLLRRGHIELGHGPRENMQRPGINVMFRTAAASYGERVAGVLLTGLLDDGAAGLWEIQQHGGATVVQDPEEATFRSMPDSAIRGLNVQYIVPIAEMAHLLTRLTMTDQRIPSASLPQPQIEPAGQVCPECGGVMTVAHMGSLREYRCHTGHRFGLHTMIEEKSRVIEHSLGTALSQSEELSRLLETALDGSGPDAARRISEELAERKEEQMALRNLAGKRRSRLES